MKSKIIVGVVATVIVYVGLSYAGLVPGMRRTASVVPQQVALSEAQETSSTAVAAVDLPKATPAKLTKPPIRFSFYPWTALHGLLFAIGGPRTTQGSLMEKHGVNIVLERQDDLEVTKKNQALFAQQLASGAANPSTGAHFSVIMGDGGAQYLGSLNKLLEPLGPDYRAEIVGSVGYSRGEDACWGPQEWKDNPEAAKGGLIAAYLRDGDWNLCQFWLSQNGIKNNPDETTWDPEAINWVSSADFLKAVEQYVTGYCEDRPIVRGGKVSGGKQHVCVQATATWTPGDVNMAKGKGGLVKLISTKENAYQMPAVVIGIHAWNVKNAKLVEELLAAAFEGSDQVKHYEAALSKAGQIAYAVYGEKNAAYWVKYYKGVTEKDKAGVPVQLGGSSVSNLADNVVLFGLGDGGAGLEGSVYNASYSGFGNIVKQQYPTLLPSFPPIGQAVNPQFITALAARVGAKTDNAELAKFEDNDSTIAKESVIAKKNWTITFETGSAAFTPQAQNTLNDLYQQLLIGGGLAVQIDGHTDNVGNPASNLVLSQQRAAAVKGYLEGRNSTLFPTGRVVTRGYGDQQPIAENATPGGKAKNRRVTITLGTQE